MGYLLTKMINFLEMIILPFILNDVSETWLFPSSGKKPTLLDPIDYSQFLCLLIGTVETSGYSQFLRLGILTVEPNR
jgi:hypothetical protein